MSIPGLIYTIGSLIAVIITVYVAFRDYKMDEENITVGVLFGIIFEAFLAGLLSWMAILVFFFIKYKDTVVFKFKK